MSESAAQEGGWAEAQVVHFQGGWPLWLRWMLATTVGELVGFAVPTAVGTAIWVIGGEGGAFTSIAMFIFMILAGGGEGAVLGFAQWIVLHRHIPDVVRRDWVLATALAAAFAWLLAMLVVTRGDLAAINTVLFVIGVIVIGLMLVASIGFAQWYVLKRHIQNVFWWIPANAVAWPLGIAMPVLGLSLVPDGSPVEAWVATGVVSGMAMGVVVGAITGIALVWLLRNHASDSEKQTS